MIENFFKTHFKTLPKAVAVGLSGGADSLALTMMLDEFCNKNQINLVAITVDHKMRQNSSKEAILVQKMLENTKISHKILTFDEAPKKNIEANLRNKRYELMAKFCHQNQIEHLFVGHNKNDVAENFLIRAFRGSQIDGIARMSDVFEFKGIKIHRPILDETKSQLIDFLQKRNLTWIEDESNDDERFLRNKIRKFFNSFEEKELIFSRINKLTKDLAQSRDLLDEILIEKAQEMLIFDNGNFLIDEEKYKKSPKKIAQKILALILMELSNDDYKPRFEALERFENDLFLLKKGQKREFFGCVAKILSGEDINKKKILAKIDFNKKFLLLYSKESKKINFRTILKQVI
jgi:tRNA(Ile)-lysidine synthase